MWQFYFLNANIYNGLEITINWVKFLVSLKVISTPANWKGKHMEKHMLGGFYGPDQMDVASI